MKNLLSRLVVHLVVCGLKRIDREQRVVELFEREVLAFERIARMADVVVDEVEAERARRMPEVM